MKTKLPDATYRIRLYLPNDLTVDMTVPRSARNMELRRGERATAWFNRQVGFDAVRVELLEEVA